MFASVADVRSDPLLAVATAPSFVSLVHPTGLPPLIAVKLEPLLEFAYRFDER
jgi:hypothetical protein